MAASASICDGIAVCAAMSSCRLRAVLVSPFIKLSALQRITASLAPAVPLDVVTRWRPEEIAAGVSDLSVADFCSERSGTRLLLLDNLHSKYFRADDTLFVGSANLTNAGMGWSSRPNEEIICRLLVSTQWLELEARILARAIPATHELRLAIEAAARNAAAKTCFHEPESQPLSELVLHPKLWIPSCRSPESLNSVYCRRFQEVPLATRVSAADDLAFLAIPSGLDSLQFESRVRLALMMTPFYTQMHGMVGDAPRFGELRRRFTQSLASSTDRDVATHELQTAMRWLTHFFPERFRVTVLRYTERLERLDHTP
jgi:hypothetical protein